MTKAELNFGNALIDAMNESERLITLSKERRASMPEDTPDQQERIRQVVDEQLFFSKAYELFEKAFDEL